MQKSYDLNLYPYSNEIRKEGLFSVSILQQ